MTIARIEDVANLAEVFGGDIGELQRSRDITPQVFGAVGDGVADDTAALQAWAAAGGTALPAGRYRLTLSLIHI